MYDQQLFYCFGCGATYLGHFSQTAEDQFKADKCDECKQSTADNNAITESGKAILDAMELHNGHFLTIGDKQAIEDYLDKIKKGEV